MACQPTTLQLKACSNAYLLVSFRFSLLLSLPSRPSLPPSLPRSPRLLHVGGVAGGLRQAAVELALPHRKVYHVHALVLGAEACPHALDAVARVRLSVVDCVALSCYICAIFRRLVTFVSSLFVYPGFFGRVHGCVNTKPSPPVASLMEGKIAALDVPKIAEQKALCSHDHMCTHARM